MDPKDFDARPAGNTHDTRRFMKTRKHKLQDSILLILFLVAMGALGYGLYLYFGKGSEGAVEAAVPEEADAVLYVNFQAMNQSAFGRAMADSEAEDLYADEFSDFLLSLGLNEDDVIEGLIAIRDLAALQGERFAQAGLSAAVRLSTIVTLPQIESALRANLDNNATVRQSTLSNRDILEFPVPDLGLTVQLTVFEREDGGATLYFGAGDALRNTITKLESRREKTLPDGILAGKDSMIAESHGWLVVVLSPAMQAGLRDLIGAAPFPLGPAGDAVVSLHRTGISLRANQSLAVQLALAFGSAEDARTVQEFLNESIVPMLQMMAAAQGDGAPGFMQNLRAEARDDTVTLTATISVDDARQMGETIIAETAPPPQPEPADVPAQPGAVTAEPETQPAPPSWPVLHVQTVLLSTNEAVVNGELLQVGDEFEGVTLHQVADDGVVFQFEQEYRFVAIGETTQDD